MLDDIWTDVDDESLKTSPAAKLIADGLNEKWRGNYRKALQNYRDALAYAQRNNQYLLIAAANMNMGNIFREWRSFDLAWAHYANAGKVSSSLSDRIKSDIANAMAGLAFENNDIATAFEGYAESLQYAEKAGDKARIATVKHNIASVFQLQREPHNAISVYEEAFEIGREYRLRHDQARTKCQIGVCWLDMGIATNARESLIEARELALSSYRIDILGDIEHNLGIAHLRLKEMDLALVALRRSAQLRLHIADQATTRYSRINARSKVVPTISLLISILFDQGNWAEALIWSELIRAREVIQFSRNQMLQRKRSGAEQLILERESYRNLVDLSLDSPLPKNTFIEDYNSTLINLLQLEESFDRIISEQQVTQLTNLGTFIEEYTSKTNDTIYVFLPLLLENMKSGLALFVSVNGRVYQKKLSPIDWNRTEYLCEKLSDSYLEYDKVEFKSLISDMLEWLDKQDIFGEKLKPHTGIPRKLIIIPWGNLHNFPLELKTLSDRPIGLETPIVRWFSLNQLREVTCQRRKMYSPRALVIADPTDDLPIYLKDYELDMKNGRLTGAFEEGKFVSDILERHGVRVDRLFRSQVTYSAVIDLLNEQLYTLIHYAGHSLFDSNYPERSALLVRDIDVTKIYPMTAEKLLLEVQLQAKPLIVLSGCRTGNIVMRSGGEPDGLMQALFSCGASALVTTGWPILDADSTDFMKSMYHALCSGKSLDEAVMIARRNCIKVDQGVTDYHLDSAIKKWASFRVYGLGGQTLI